MPSSTMLPAVPGKVAVGAEASRGLVQGCFTSICGAEQLCRLSSAGWQLHSLGCACTAWPRCPGAHRVPFPADAIRAVCLPPSHRDLFQGTPCWVSGWGYTRPDQGRCLACPCPSVLTCSFPCSPLRCSPFHAVPGPALLPSCSLHPPFSSPINPIRPPSSS